MPALFWWGLGLGLAPWCAALGTGYGSGIGWWFYEAAMAARQRHDGGTAGVTRYCYRPPLGLGDRYRPPPPQWDWTETGE